MGTESGRLTTGYTFDVLQLPRGTVTLGVAPSWSWVAPEIQPEYGGTPKSMLGFVQLALH